jgi:hypothetical protein
MLKPYKISDYRPKITVFAAKIEEIPELANSTRSPSTSYPFHPAHGVRFCRRAAPTALRLPFQIFHQFCGICEIS